MNTIFITGSTGFVGTHLQNYLKTEHEVQPMSVRYKPNQQFEIKEDVLIHLAGKAHDLKKVPNPQEYYEANFELINNCLRLFYNLMPISLFTSVL